MVAKVMARSRFEDDAGIDGSRCMVDADDMFVTRLQARQTPYPASRGPIASSTIPTRWGSRRA